MRKNTFKKSIDELIANAIESYVPGNGEITYILDNEEAIEFVNGISSLINAAIDEYCIDINEEKAVIVKDVQDLIDDIQRLRYDADSEVGINIFYAFEGEGDYETPYITLDYSANAAAVVIKDDKVKEVQICLDISYKFPNGCEFEPIDPESDSIKKIAITKSNSETSESGIINYCKRTTRGRNLVLITGNSVSDFKIEINLEARI